MRKKKFPDEPAPEEEIVTLRREHRQQKATLRERDQQIVFLAGVLRKETEAVDGLREVLQTFCRTVLAVRVPDELATEAWGALVELAEEWEGGGDEVVASERAAHG